MIKLAFLCGISVAAILAREETPDKRLQNAADAFQEVMSAPDKAIPK